MDCRDIHEKFSDYMEGLLPEDEKNLIQQHIEKCTICFREYQEFKKIMQLVQNLPEIKAPDDFTETVMQKIVERQYLKRRRLTLWLGRMAFAEAIALVLIVLFNQPQKEHIIEPGKSNITQKIEQSETIEKQKKASRQKLVKKEIKKTETHVIPQEKRTVSEITIQLAYKTALAEKPVEKRLEEIEKRDEVTTDRPAGPIVAAPMMKEALKERERKLEKAVIPNYQEKVSVESELVTVVSKMEGKIISLLSREDAELRGVVSVELPARTYADFLMQLADKFQIKNLSEIKDITLSETTVRLKIEIFKQ